MNDSTASPFDDALDRVLTLALAERAGAAPPDVAGRVAARRTAPASAAMRASRRTASPVVAATLLAGALVVVATALWSPTDPDDRTSRSFAGHPHDPRTLAELQRRLGDIESATLATRGLWSESLQRWVPIERMPLDDLFARALLPRLDADARTAIATAVQNAAVSSAGDEAAIVWTHEITLQTADAPCTVLLRVGRGAPPRLGFRSQDGPVRLHSTQLDTAPLEPLLHDTTRATIEQLGVALGRRGFAALPDRTTRLRPIDAPFDALDELDRFRALRSLDLRASPAWHRAEAFERLATRDLKSLIAAPRHLDRAAFEALGQLRHVEELFLFELPLEVLMHRRRAPHRAPTLDDDALAAIAGLTRLEELTLVGGACTDAGLQHLQELPLRRLALIDCHGVEGTRLGGMRIVTRLSLDRCALVPEAIDAIAAMPALEHLTLAGPLPRTALPRLAAAAHLRELRLLPTPPLHEGELELLTSLGNLKRLEVEGVGDAGLRALRAALPDTVVRAAESRD